ncbi:uncharacterized protein LOC129610777 isoform X2 [Condylostylus longicornis]|uniref:uncharacterized protein LOC129610777 isoform X2 n=1 Tax=Condylostylus longicornis TaxID=2530218 RepID=UPI00244E23FB|nr:uncharacterized protein LOC129610777 isoform X2 [Condylostylus longicornis]
MQTDKKIKLDLNENILEYLPLEILLKICSYLNGEDIKNLKLTCKHWNEITEIPQVAGRLRLKLVLITSKSTREKVNFFQNSNQKFYDISLQRCNVDLLASLFKIIGKETKILTIEDCHFYSDDVLKDILNSTRNIEILRILHCSFNQCVIPKYDKVFENIKVLEILNKPVTKTKYGEVINIIHNIGETNLSCFTMNYIYKIFREGNPSKIREFSQMVLKNHENLKELNLLDCCFVEEKFGVYFWECLMKCKLEKFSASHVPPNADSEKFMKFLISQKNLRYLKLVNIRSLTDDMMETLVSNLSDLREIELLNCVNLTDKGVLYLKKLKELNSLNITYHIAYEILENITITSILNGIAQEKNHKLTELSLCNIKMTVDQLCQVIKNLPSLKKLKCESVKMMVQNEALEVSKILSNNMFLSNLSFVNYKTNKEENICQNNRNIENRILNTLEVSYSESCRNILRAIKLPNLRTLKVFYHDDRRQKDNGKDFVKALYNSSPALEHISLTVMSDIDTILDFIFTSFKKLKSIQFDWHCGDCRLYKRIHVKTNQRLHPLLRKSPSGNFQFDETCERCNNLFSKLY